MQEIGLDRTDEIWMEGWNWTKWVPKFDLDMRLSLSLPSSSSSFSLVSYICISLSYLMPYISCLASSFLSPFSLHLRLAFTLPPPHPSPSPFPLPQRHCNALRAFLRTDGGGHGWLGQEGRDEQEDCSIATFCLPFTFHNARMLSPSYHGERRLLFLLPRRLLQGMYLGVLAFRALQIAYLLARTGIFDGM